MAPPGAETTTPPWPSGVGPLEDQVYCWPCSAHSPLTNGGRAIKEAQDSISFRKQQI